MERSDFIPALAQLELRKDGVEQVLLDLIGVSSLSQYSRGIAYRKLA
jgi:hypothetical protein